MRGHEEWLKRGDRATPVLTGKDAIRFVEAMKNPAPIPREEYLRARAVYEAVEANSKRRRSSVGRASAL
jgi:hypothetical protein